MAEIIDLAPRLPAAAVPHVDRSAFEELLQVLLDTPDTLASTITVIGMLTQLMALMGHVAPGDESEDDFIDYIRGELRTGCASAVVQRAAGCRNGPTS